MAVVISAARRGGLPPALRACECSRCIGPREEHAEENRLAAAHYHLKRPNVRVDFSFIVNEWRITYQEVELDEHGHVIAPRAKRNARKCSILEFPDEILVLIAGHLGDSVYKYCLALCCKRLLAIVMERDPKKKPKLARQANNVTGPWKEQLMVALARGWIPKHELKLCFACWRFMPYGAKSKKKYFALEKARACHLRKKDWLDNWEVKIWFRRMRAAKNDWMTFIADGRLRCPMCVLEGHDLHVRDRKYRKKVLQGPELEALKELKELSLD